jgi:glyoxylase-like metal-dependent hydrolase (beta-lactamase superfamily II)
VVFALPDLAFTGDTIFAGSIGRPDLPGGDYELLLDGIRKKLLTLPADTRLLPGHGPETTPGTESASNPYFT